MLTLEAQHRTSCTPSHPLALGEGDFAHFPDPGCKRRDELLAPTLESLLFWSSMTRMSSSIFLIFPSAVTFSSCSFCLAASSSSNWSSRSFGGDKHEEKEQ